MKNLNNPLDNSIGTYVDSIMNCCPEKFNEICLSFLHRLDDWQQVAGDLDQDDDLHSFCDDYQKIEAIIWKLKSGNPPTDLQRNSVRMTMKEAGKVASLLIDPSTNKFFETAVQFNNSLLL